MRLDVQLTPIWLALALLASCCIPGYAKDILSESEFAAAYFQHARKHDPSVSFTATGDETYDVTMSDGSDISVYLGNAYRQYASDPELKDEIIEQHVQALLQARESLDDEGKSADRIVPIVRTSDYFDAVANKPNFDIDNYITEDVAPGLQVIYAFDLPETIRSLQRDDLEELGLKPSDLPILARNNLMRLYGRSMKVGGEDGFYYIADGTSYESSMIALDIWSKENFPVKGEIVVFVPGRDYLLITGSEDADGLRQGRKISADIVASGAYSMIEHPLILRDGKWRRFK